jgi:hypothetical protein
MSELSSPPITLAVLALHQHFSILRFSRPCANFIYFEQCQRKSNLRTPCRIPSPDIKLSKAMDAHMAFKKQFRAECMNMRTICVRGRERLSASWSLNCFQIIIVQCTNASVFHSAKSNYAGIQTIYFIFPRFVHA